MANVKRIKTDNPLTNVVLRASSELDQIKKRITQELGTTPFMKYERSYKERKQLFNQMTVEDFNRIAQQYGEQAVRDLIAKYGEK